jgi:hypothetical protein
LRGKKTPDGIVGRVELLSITTRSGLSGDYLDAFAMALTARAYHLCRAVAYTNNSGPLDQRQAQGTKPAIWSV